MIRVLIVEDDPMVAELNRRYIERVEGFVFCGVAANAEAALEVLKERPLDLVLLDIFMPGMNGLELLSTMRQLRHGVDVIVVSAARDNHSIQTALRYGAVDYLIKPFEFERLQAALQAFRRRLQLMQQQNHLSQQELDQQVFNGLTSGESELPKGLDRNTIKRIWGHIERMTEEFTAEEMANQVGLSPVSMRKYLKYFQSQDWLEVDISYGAVGRPVYKYRYIAKP